MTSRRNADRRSAHECGPGGPRSTPTAGARCWVWRSARSEAEPFWTKFLRSLTRRGLRGVSLVISDAHEGLKKAVLKVLSATWQRFRVHFMRNALAHVGAKQRQMAAAAIRTAFTQETPAAAGKEWRAVADRLRALRQARRADGEAEDDVLAHMSFPKEQRQQLHSTNPLERLNREIKRRTDVVAIFPNEAGRCTASAIASASR